MFARDFIFILLKNARSEVLTLVLLKFQVFWDVTLCHLARSSWHFEGSQLSSSSWSSSWDSLTLKIEALFSSLLYMASHP